MVARKKRGRTGRRVQALQRSVVQRRDLDASMNERAEAWPKFPKARRISSSQQQ